MATVRQSTVATLRKQGPGDRGTVTLKATFEQPTVPGSLIVAVATATGGMPISLQISNSGYTQLLPSKGLRDLQSAAWYRLNAPSTSSLTMTMDSYRGVVWRLFEVQGIAQASALDRFMFATGESESASTGLTSTLTASGEWAFAVISSQYGSTTQSGFTGGLTTLYQNTVPDNGNEDWERGRVSYHAANLSSTAAQRVNATLGTSRRWIGFVATFKAGVTGPAKFTATNVDVTTVSGSGRLTVFGRLRLTDHGNNLAWGGVEVVRARMGPSDYQYRLGGWTGLLIGAHTDYRVESVKGLEGATVRFEDTDQPRDDGAVRGLDLQMPRTVMFKLRAAPDAADRDVVEARLEALYRALRPQRTDDWELIWRHPGRPLRSLYCRPIDTMRELSIEQALTGEQVLTLRAADPRHYSAVVRRVTVPVSPDESEVVTVVAATNSGNDRSYPLIRITGPTSGPDVSRVQLVNASANTTFDVATLLQPGAELIGNMRARVVGARTSVVTLNGTSKYGSWQQPRQPWYLAPDPDAEFGQNVLYLRTTPAGAPVTCTIEYQDTWSG